jgi:hypothetical protein
MQSATWRSRLACARSQTIDIDDIPFDGDERRAWYDTLRDLVPLVHGFKPTVRIYAEEFPWCSLDANSKSDNEIFQTLLSDRLPAR